MSSAFSDRPAAIIPAYERPPMTEQIPSLTPHQSAELAAFLRGLERRAAAFAELACGDASRGDDALAAAMRAFRNACSRGSQAHAGTLFWSLLVAAPQLRTPSDSGHWPPSLVGLAALGHGARVAVLLRLVAGLDDDAAAAALRVAPGTFARAVQHAVAMPAGSPRAAFWEQTARAIEHRIQHTPPERLVRLAAMRERAVNGRAAVAARIGWRPRWVRPAAGTVVLLCAVAITATFLRHDPSAADPRIALAPLPAAAPPVDTFDAEAALLTHRDFEQLADLRNAALVHDLDFYAWYAAQLADSRSATPMLLPDAAKPLPGISTGTTHAPR